MRCHMLLLLPIRASAAMLFRHVFSRYMATLHITPRDTIYDMLRMIFHMIRYAY